MCPIVGPVQRQRGLSHAGHAGDGQKGWKAVAEPTGDILVQTLANFFPPEELCHRERKLSGVRVFR